MAHNILGNQFAGTESAWHRLGINDATILSAMEAVTRGGMDWDIIKHPLSANMPNGLVILTDYYGLIRPPVAGSDEWITLGTCGKDYSFWQNAEVARMIDLLSDKTGWKFSTAGILDNGATIFICLEATTYSIMGDEVKQFFVYKETRNGLRSSAAIMSNIRVVCQNTLDLATRSATGMIKLKHHSDYKSDSEWAMDLMAEAQRTGQNVSAAMKRLAEIKVDDETFTGMLADVAPMPSMPRILTMQALTGRMKEKREAAEYAYTMATNKAMANRNQITANWVDASDIPANLVGTAWHGYQAVTGFTSHQYGTLGTRGRKMGDSARALWDLTEGTKMRSAAYEYLTSELAD